MPSIRRRRLPGPLCSFYFRPMEIMLWTGFVSAMHNGIVSPLAFKRLSIANLQIFKAFECVCEPCFYLYVPCTLSYWQCHCPLFPSPEALTYLPFNTPSKWKLVLKNREETEENETWRVLWVTTRSEVLNYNLMVSAWYRLFIGWAEGEFNKESFRHVPIKLIIMQLLDEIFSCMIKVDMCPD